MPKGLSDRLKDLENQINYFISTQKGTLDGCCRIIRGKSVIRQPGAEIEEIQFEATTCPGAISTVRPASSPGPILSKSECGLVCAEHGRSRPRSLNNGKRKSSALLSPDSRKPPTPSHGRGSPPCICILQSPSQVCTCKSKKRRKGSLSPPTKTEETSVKSVKETNKSKEERIKSPLDKSRRTSPKQGKGEGSGFEFKDVKKNADGFADRGKGDKKGGAKGTSEKGKGDKKGGAKGTAEQGKGDKKGGAKGRSEQGKGGAKTENIKSALKGGKGVSQNDLKKLEEYEALLKQQQNKLQQMETQLTGAEKAKQVALNSTNELKTKYEELRVSKASEGDEIQKLKKEKDELTKKLQVETERRVNLEEKAKEAVQQERKNLTEKVEKIELNAVNSVKKMRKHSKALTSAVRLKDDHIRKLSGTTEKLAESIREKESENRRLSAAQKEIVQNFLHAKEANKKLADTNEGLIKNIKHFQEKLHNEKSMVQKMQKQICICKAECVNFSVEITRLKEKLRDAMRAPKCLRNWSKLQDKLRESLEREKLSTDEAAVIAKKMQEYCEAHNASAQFANTDLVNITKEQKKLQAKYESVLKQLQITKEENELRIQTMAEEFERFKKEAERKQNILLKEKAGLQADFNRLRDAAAEDQVALAQLLAYTALQERVIQSYKNVIAAKEINIESLGEDIEEMRLHVGKLEKQIIGLKEDIEASGKEAELQKKQIAELRAQLEEVREQIIAKQKIISEQMSKIEDLNVTIAELQQKINIGMRDAKLARQDTEHAYQQITKINNQLNTTKEERKSLSTEMRTIKVGDGGGGIKSKVEKVEKIVNDLCKCANVGGDSNLINVYEHKFGLIKKGADLQMQLVIKQKEQAINVARFVTQKLLETATDFQNQVEIHKKVQVMLMKMLKQKEHILKKRRARRDALRDVSKVSNDRCGCGSVEVCKLFETLENALVESKLFSKDSPTDQFICYDS